MSFFATTKSLHRFKRFQENDWIFFFKFSEKVTLTKISKRNQKRNKQTNKQPQQKEGGGEVNGDTVCRKTTTTTTTMAFKIL